MVARLGQRAGMTSEQTSYDLCVMRDDLPHLFQFFAGRFHQDWDVDAEDDDGVIERFLLEEPEDFATAVRIELRSLLDMRLGEDELRRATWEDLGCEYNAVGSSTRAWLQSVARRLDETR